MAISVSGPSAAGQGEVARTWNAAKVWLYSRGYEVNGFMSGTLTRERLYGLPADASFPTIIFLYDCAGPQGPQGPLFA